MISCTAQGHIKDNLSKSTSTDTGTGTGTRARACTIAKASTGKCTSTSTSTKASTGTDTGTTDKPFESFLFFCHTNLYFSLYKSHLFLHVLKSSCYWHTVDIFQISLFLTWIFKTFNAYFIFVIVFAISYHKSLSTDFLSLFTDHVGCAVLSLSSTI